MKRFKSYLNKYVILVMVLFGFFLRISNAYCNQQLKNPEKKESSFNYIIVDDLLNFIRSPYETILSHHSVLAWTVPTIILFGFDNRLTNFYISEVETRVRDAGEAGYIVQLNDQLIFSSLKNFHILNAVYYNDDRLYRFTYSVSEAIVDSYFVAQGLKMITGRARPVLSDKGPNSWFQPTLNPMGENTSFPSLHATYFFSVSTIIGKSIDNEILGDFIGVLSFFSMAGHNHWISDMWVGYLLGKSIGYYVWNKNRNADLRDKWWVHLEFRPGVVGPHPSICFLKVF